MFEHKKHQIFWSVQYNLMLNNLNIKPLPELYFHFFVFFFFKYIFQKCTLFIRRWGNSLYTVLIKCFRGSFIRYMIQGDLLKIIKRPQAMQYVHVGCEKCLNIFSLAEFVILHPAPPCCTPTVRWTKPLWSYFLQIPAFQLRNWRLMLQNMHERHF